MSELLASCGKKIPGPDPGSTRPCDAKVIRGVDRRGRQVDLDPTPVVGGDYTLNGASKFIEARPSAVRPTGWKKPDLSDKAFQAAARQAADEKPWWVLHRCGMTAEQIVAETSKDNA